MRLRFLEYGNLRGELEIGAAPAASALSAEAAPEPIAAPLRIPARGEQIMLRDPLTGEGMHYTALQVIHTYGLAEDTGAFGLVGVDIELRPLHPEAHIYNPLAGAEG